MGILSLAFKFYKLFIFNATRKIFGFYQFWFWLLTGVYVRKWWHGRKRCQVLRVLLRHKIDLVLEPSGPSNFITIHHSFQDPKYVLKDHITLYYVTKNEAVFVETDPRVDVTHSNAASFIRVAQFKYAKRIIIMPIAAFHDLAESLPERDHDLIFVSNTTRCGSTLLSQVFEETNRVLSFSEPDALNAIGLYDGRIPQEELDRLVINSVRVQCKPISRPISAYLLKTTGPTIDAVPLFIRLFPKSHQLFMYREGLKVAQSLARSGLQMPLLELTFVFTRYSEALTRKGVEAMGLSPDMFKVRARDPLVFCLFVWAVITDKYLQYRRQGIDIVAVKYEDLVKHPLAATKAVFEYCGLDSQLAVDAIKALDRDAQRNSPLSMKKLNTWNVLDLTPEKKALTDQICDQFDLPRIPEPCVVDGTITAISNITGSGMRNGTQNGTKNGEPHIQYDSQNGAP